MGASVRPERDDLLERQIAALQQQGASDDDIQAFINQRATRRPVAAASDATNIRPDAVTHKREAMAPHSFGGDVLGFFQNMTKGAPLGTFLDEAAALQVGLLTNPTNPLKNFERNRAHFDQPAQDYQKRHGTLATLAQVSGAMATGLPAANVGRQIVGRLLTPAGAGAAGAAAAMPTQTIGQRAATAGLNTAAAAAEAAISGAGEVGGGITPRIAAARRAGTIGGVLGGALGAGGVAKGALADTELARKTVNAMPRPAGAASNPIGRAIRASGVRSHDDLAAADFLTALGREGMDLDEFAERLGSRPDELALDVGTPRGQLVREARKARSINSTGARKIDDAITERIQRRPEQVEGAVETAFGGKRQNPITEAQRLAGEQRAKAKPLYEEAYAFGMIEDPQVRQQVEGLFNADPKLFKSIFQNADLTARLDPEDGRALVNPFRTIKGVGGEDIESIGNIDVRTLDHLKKGLDAIIEKRGADGAAVLTRAQARGLRNRLNAIMDRVDEVVVTEDGRHIYREARNTWADDAEALEALEEGRKFATASADDVEALYPTLSPQAQEQYRLAANAAETQALQRRRGSPDLTAQLLTPNEQRKFGTVIPESQPQLQETLQRLQRMRENDLFIAGGSQTADKLADQLDGGVGPFAEIGAAVTGGPTALLELAGKGALKRRLAGAGERRIDALADLLLTRGDDLSPTLQRLRDVIAREQARIARQGTLSRAIGRVTGSANEP